MRNQIVRFVVRLVLTGHVVCCASLFAQDTQPDLKWKMHTINDQSPYEACGAADFNGDGKIDIFCGD